VTQINKQKIVSEIKKNKENMIFIIHSIVEIRNKSSGTQNAKVTVQPR